MKNLLNRLMALLLTVTLLAGCTQKELCYLHPHCVDIRLVFDWVEAPDANPESMVVYFYPLPGEAAQVQRFDIVTVRTRAIESARINVQTGRYRIICYNSDTDGILIDGHEDFHTHSLYTRDGDIFESLLGSGVQSSRAPRGEADNQRVVITPDMMWGCSTMEVEITDAGIRYINDPTSRDEARADGDGRGFGPYRAATMSADGQVITLYPHQQVAEYSFEIRNVENIRTARMMCAAVSGLSGRMVASTEALHPEPVIIPSTAGIENGTKITGNFYTFGNYPDGKTPHTLLLYVWLADGKQYYYTFDATEQIDHAPDRLRVHMVFDKLSLPTPITNGSGLSPSVDGWDEEIGDIIM